MRGFISIVFTIFIYKIHGQIYPQILRGSKSHALGNISAPIQDAFALRNNPAGLVGIEKTSILLSSEWLYGVKNLNPMIVGIATPTGSGVFGFGYQYFRFSNMRQSQLSAAFGKKMATNINVGIRLEYQNIRVVEYRPLHIFAFSIGCNYLITNDLRLGFVAHNLSSSLFKKAEDTPSVLQLGAAYSINKMVQVLLEVEKDITLPLALKLGIDYKMGENFTARCGVKMSQQAQFNFGFGYAFSKNFTIEMSLSNHAILGLTPSISMLYNFDKKANFTRSN